MAEAAGGAPPAAEGGAPAPAAPKESSWQGGTLLFAGGTDWAMIGRAIGKSKKELEAKREETYPNLHEPYRLKSLKDVRIMFVAAGPAAVHCLAGDANGNLYAWGRNERGQLGHGDNINRNNPTIVEALRGKHVIAAAGGRHHTLVCTKEGDSYSFGLNQQGQLGIGTVKKGGKGAEDVHLLPVKAHVPGASKCAAGIDFSMWLADGKLYSAGSPQYGQTGDGSDHSYNAKDSSISMAFEPQPTPKVIPAFADVTITNVACGHNHTIAVDNAGSCYTWGHGGYGRLGHRVQRDEHAPMRVAEFQRRLTISPDALCAAGSTGTFVLATVGAGTPHTAKQLYCWGKLKVSGENLMYPIPDQNMSGWNVRSVACGPQHFAIAADNSVITWGFATNYELGYGPGAKKSSASAAKVESLQDMHTEQVACGTGFTMFLVSPDAPNLDKRPEYHCDAPDMATNKADLEEADEGGQAGGAKRKGGVAAAGGAKKGKK